MLEWLQQLNCFFFSVFLSHPLSFYQHIPLSLSLSPYLSLSWLSLSLFRSLADVEVGSGPVFPVRKASVPMDLRVTQRRSGGEAAMLSPLIYSTFSSQPCNQYAQQHMQVTHGAGPGSLTATDRPVTITITGQSQYKYHSAVSRLALSPKHISNCRNNTPWTNQ